MKWLRYDVNRSYELWPAIRLRNSDLKPNVKNSSPFMSFGLVFVMYKWFGFETKVQTKIGAYLMSSMNNILGLTVRVHSNFKYKSFVQIVDVYRTKMEILDTFVLKCVILR